MPVFSGHSGCTDAQPCKKGYGDCDTDDQCEGSLKCYQRADGERVPGLLVFPAGVGSPSSDYCYDQNDANDFTVVTSSNLVVADTSGGGEACTSTSPCAEGFGDCDKHSECEGSLKCYYRDSGEFVPGIDTSQLEEDQGGYDLCFDPAKLDARGDTWCSNITAADIAILGREFAMEMVFEHCNDVGLAKFEILITDSQRCRLHA